MSSLYHKYFFALPRYQTDLELRRKATIYAKESLSSVRVIILIISIITSDNGDKWSLVIFLISCDQFKPLYLTIHLRFSWGTLSTQESPKTSGHPCLALSATLVAWWVEHWDVIKYDQPTNIHEWTINLISLHHHIIIYNNYNIKLFTVCIYVAFRRVRNHHFAIINYIIIWSYQM